MTRGSIGAIHHIEFLLGQTLVLTLFPVIVAPFIGSFLGLVIRRLPVGGAIVTGRSVCPHCGQTLAPRDLIPLVSWALARGKCRYCGVGLGSFYPAVELAATTIAVLAMILIDDPVTVWLACGLGWSLLCLSWIDAETFLLPDVLTLPLVLAGLAASIPGGRDAMLDAGIGAAVGFCALWLVARVYRGLTQEDGLGDGDFKLFAAAGAWTGWEFLPWVVFMASVFGLIAALAARAVGREVTRKTRIPFGPFIAAAIWVAYLLLHGDLLLSDAIISS